MIRKEQRSAEPLLVYPGLVELNDISWAQIPGNRDYILAPFGYYSIDLSQTLIIPSAFESGEARSYFERVVSPRIEGATSFLLVSPRMIQLAPKPVTVGNPTYLLGYFKKIGFMENQISSDGPLQLYRLTRINS